MKLRRIRIIIIFKNFFIRKFILGLIIQTKRK